MIKLTELKELEDNPRDISIANVEKLQNSITQYSKFMALNPIIVDEDNVILAGNQRYKALQALEYEEIPDSWVRKVNDLSEKEKKEFVVIQNTTFGKFNNKVKDFVDIDFDAFNIKFSWDVQDMAITKTKIENIKPVEVRSPMLMQITPHERKELNEVKKHLGLKKDEDVISKVIEDARPLMEGSKQCVFYIDKSVYKRYVSTTDKLNRDIYDDNALMNIMIDNLIKLEGLK